MLRDPINFESKYLIKVALPQTIKGCPVPTVVSAVTVLRRFSIADRDKSPYEVVAVAADARDAIFRASVIVVQRSFLISERSSETCPSKEAILQERHIQRTNKRIIGRQANNII